MPSAGLAGELRYQDGRAAASPLGWLNTLCPQAPPPLIPWKATDDLCFHVSLGLALKATLAAQGRSLFRELFAGADGGCLTPTDPPPGLKRWAPRRLTGPCTYSLHDFGPLSSSLPARSLCLHDASTASAAREAAGTHHRAARGHLLHPQHDLLAERGRPEDLRHQSSAACLLGGELPPAEEHLVGLEKQRQAQAEGRGASVVLSQPAACERGSQLSEAGSPTGASELLGEPHANWQTRASVGICLSRGLTALIKLPKEAMYLQGSICPMPLPWLAAACRRGHVSRGGYSSVLNPQL